MHLAFLRLRNEELAIKRVAFCVAQGGHDVSTEIIRRRFKEGWQNIQLVYTDLVDSWDLYDNSGRTREIDQRRVKAIKKDRRSNNGRLLGVEAALRRAAQRAPEVAARTGTPLVIYSDGKIKRIEVGPKPATRSS